MSNGVIRISELASTPAKPGKLPVSPATVWRWVREGKFPKPFKLGESVTVWNWSRSKTSSQSVRVKPNERAH